MLFCGCIVYKKMNCFMYLVRRFDCYDKFVCIVCDYFVVECDVGVCIVDVDGDVMDWFFVV